MFNKFRLPFIRPFRRKSRKWRYRQVDPDEEEGEARSKTNYNSDLWVLPIFLYYFFRN